jgi:predicted esterase
MNRMYRFLALLSALLAAFPANAATTLKAGGLSEFNVELPSELRQAAGRGQLSLVAHALVTFAVPAGFEAARGYPVMIVSATSDPQFHSSRSLLHAYAETAFAAGWILMAADPAEEVSVERDDVGLRYALNAAALAALASQWPAAGKAPLAFGGFSGGAKYSGWLAAAFARQGRSIIGIYLAGINSDTIVPAGQHFNVLKGTFKRVPVFLQSGENDEIATPADHQVVRDELQRAGFRYVRLERVAGSHEVDPAPLRAALDWFRELAAHPVGGR